MAHRERPVRDGRRPRARRALAALLLALLAGTGGCMVLPYGANEEDGSAHEPTAPRRVFGIEVYDYGDPAPGSNPYPPWP